VVVRFPRARVLSRKELLRLADEALPLVGQYVLVAESFSGQMAIEIAARNPRRLRGLVLAGTFASRPVVAAVALLGWVFGEVVMRVNPPGWVVRKFLVGPDGTDENVEKVRAAIGSVKGAVLASRLRMVLRCDVRRLLRLIKAPTFVFAGKNDRLVRRECAEEMAEGIGGAKLVWVDGPHLLLLTRPREVLGNLKFEV
jgi:pimeloyl-[acyl-carrier protein] methyl ester esterase